MSSTTPLDPPSDKDKENADKSVKGSDDDAINKDGIKPSGIQVDFDEDEELNAPLDTANLGTIKVENLTDAYNDEFPDPTANASVPTPTLVTEDQAAKATPLPVDFSDDDDETINIAPIAVINPTPTLVTEDQAAKATPLPVDFSDDDDETINIAPIAVINPTPTLVTEDQAAKATPLPVDFSDDDDETINIAPVAVINPTPTLVTEDQAAKATPLPVDFSDDDDETINIAPVAVINPTPTLVTEDQAAKATPLPVDFSDDDDETINIAPIAVINPTPTLVTEDQAAKATPLPVDFGDDEDTPPPPPPKDEDEAAAENLSNFSELPGLDGSDIGGEEIPTVASTPHPDDVVPSAIGPINESEALDKFSSKIDESGEDLSEDDLKKYAEEFAKLFPDISKSISKIADKDSEESKKLAGIKPTDDKSPTQQKPGVVVSSTESTPDPAKDKQQELATKGLDFAMKHPVIASMVANIVAPGSGAAVKEALEAANKSGLKADQIVSTDMNQKPGARVDSADPQSPQLDQKNPALEAAPQTSPTTVTSPGAQKPKPPQPKDDSEKTQKASGEGEEENKKKEEKPTNERDNPSPGSINPWEFLFDAIAKTIAMTGAFAIDVAKGAVKGTLTATGGALKIFPGMQPMNGFKDILKGAGQVAGPAIGVVGNAVKFLPIPYAEKMGNGIASLAPEESLKTTTKQMEHEFPDAVKAFKGSPIEPKTPAPAANQPPATPTTPQAAAPATQQPDANSASNSQAQQLTKIKASAAALKTDGASIPPRSSTAKQDVDTGAPMLIQAKKAQNDDNISFKQQMALQKRIQEEQERMQANAQSVTASATNKPQMKTR